MPNLTGIKLTDECLSQWQEFYHGRHRFIILKFSEDLRWIGTEMISGADATYDDFLDALPPREVRYGIIHFPYQVGGGAVSRMKTVLVCWAPDSAPARQKMVLAGSTTQVHEALTGIAVIHNATDDSEATYESVLQRVLAHTH